MAGEYYTNDMAGVNTEGLEDLVNKGPRGYWP